MQIHRKFLLFKRSFNESFQVQFNKTLCNSIKK